MKKILFFLSLLLSVTTMYGKGFGKTLELPNFNSGKAVWILRAGIGFNGVVGNAKGTQEAIWDDGDWSGSFKNTSGYVVSFGFNKSFGSHPLYWGMSLDLGKRGYQTNAEWVRSGKSQVSGGSDYHKKTAQGTLSCYNVQLSPITIGYKYTFLQRMALDVHLGAYASYDFSGNYKTYTSDHIVSTSKYGNRNDFKENEAEVKIGDIDNMRKYDVGINVGAGYWFGHFNIDFTWQRGFIPIYEGGDKKVSIGKGDKREQGNFFSNNFQLRLGYAF
ncbi:MAG: outer membrane beta-barrel protein [Muribaculum sp.]|nr:outer membrane beta-barrel protein [Muribaculum sp.]